MGGTAQLSQMVTDTHGTLAAKLWSRTAQTRDCLSEEPQTEADANCRRALS